MSEIKVTYFDVNGGRGEPIRIALHAAGKPFTDFRFKFNEFPDVAKTTPFGQVPTVHFGDEQVTQCNALTRYAGKLAGLYPKDDYQALLCDEVMEATEDISYKLVTTFGMEGDELKEARERNLQRNIVPHLRWLNQKLEQRGDYLADNQLTVADIKVFVVDYESQADLKVYKQKYESNADGNEGEWYFCDYESQADKTIYFVDYESQADLKIYFVDYESQAGWRNSAKKHLLY